MAKKSKARSPKTKAKKPEKTQATRFKEAARRIGADESGKLFEAAVGKIVKRKHSAA